MYKTRYKAELKTPCEYKAELKTRRPWDSMVKERLVLHGMEEMCGLYCLLVIDIIINVCRLFNVLLHETEIYGKEGIGIPRMTKREWKSDWERDRRKDRSKKRETERKTEIVTERKREIYR